VASLENFRLVVFRAVAEELSFRKAAEQLYLTQPAVSLQIKALEEELGVQLFDRAGHSITLTPAGRVLLGYACQSGELLLAAEQEIAAIHGVHAGNLTLGASTTIAQYVLPGLLSGFRRLHPRVHPRLVSGNTEKIVAAVEKHTVALGLIEGPAQNRHVKTEPFLRDELVPIVAISHPWAARGKVACAELGAAPLLMRERGSGTRRIVEMALEHHGFRRSALKIAMELDSTETIKSAVEAGLGIGFVSRCALSKDLRLGRSFKVVEVEGLRVFRDFLVVKLAGPGPHGLAMEFHRFLSTLGNKKSSRHEANPETR
jgi:DNA-binding transcriptional LysR family regulator